MLRDVAIVPDDDFGIECWQCFLSDCTFGDKSETKLASSWLRRAMRNDHKPV